MRLRRLALENWRGIESCELRFADGVTIVEGPNEAGKSTLVEALLTLVRELDSSKKQGIKAVMPAGRDVGSRVEAEIESGPYHFVYAKTYNKSPQTTLEVRAPRVEQVTGREAHERVEAILGETVDITLWEALLTEQGASLAPAQLRDSEGLSRALDEAAGHATVGIDDTDLYEAARAEYERYFTLKAGKPKFGDLEQAFEAAVTARDAAAAALAEVERDVEAHGRLRADVRRRREALPGLRAGVAGHEASWQSIAKLRQALELAGIRLAAALEQQAAAVSARDERKALAEAVAAGERALAGQNQKLQPLVERVAGLDREVDAARLAAADRRERRNAARERIEAARRQLAFVEDRDRLLKNERRLEQYAAVAAELTQASKTVNGVAVDDAGLETIREASHELDKVRSRRDLAATAVTVTAEDTLELDIDGERVSLAADGAEERVVASGLEIRFPGVASVRVTPPRTAAELETELREARTVLEVALQRYGVADLAAAIRQNEIRRNAEAEAQQLKSRLKELLAGQTAEELGEEARFLRQRCEAFLETRGDGERLPETPAEAREALARAGQSVADADAAFEAAEQHEAGVRAEHAEADAALREAKEVRIGEEAMLEDRRGRLEAARAEMPDTALEDRLRDAARATDELQAAVAADRSRLEELAPDAVEALYRNSKDALARAERDLVEAERNLAVLDDRLGRARADGRFEDLEAAERRVEETGAELDAVRRRAAAAERLWTALNRHRDAARQAYVEPLKEAVERLGRIVFGPDFEVSIGEDWTIESRSLGGITLPFDALSVGAREQIGILVRLAAARVVSRQGGVPLLIDDALGFSDPSRLETMGAAIAAAGRDCQVIILTCTPGRFAHVGNAEVLRF